jgi:hypothetical protein
MTLLTLKVSSSSWRVGASQTVPASELGKRPCPQRGRKVIVNLFKAETHSCQELQGITLVSICRKMFTNMLQAHESQAHLHEAQAAFRSKRRTDNLFVLTRILQEAGKQTVYAFFLTCAKRMIRSGGMGYPPSC